MNKAFKYLKYSYFLQFCFLSIFLSYLRNPLYFIYPRIWAEDGTVYLYYSFGQSFWNIFNPNNTGLAEINYFSFYPNLISHFSANIFPIAYAAHVNTYASAFFQLFTCLVIYYSIFDFFKNKYISIFLGLSPIILSSPEIWFTLISAQYWGTTGLLFILNSKKHNFLQILYSIFAFFTGIGSIFLLPFFIIRTTFQKTRDISSILICFVGSLASIIQLNSFFQSDSSSLRFKIDFLKNLPRGLFSTLIPRFINITNPEGLGSSNVLYNPFTIFVFSLFLLLVLLSSLLILRHDSKFKTITRLILPTFFYWLLSTIGSLDMTGGERYGLPVYCGLTFLILLAIEERKSKIYRHILILVFSFIYLLRIPVFFQTSKFYDSSWPKWKDQVIARDFKREATIKIFPQWENSINWEVKLPSFER